MWSAAAWAFISLTFSRASVLFNAQIGLCNRIFLTWGACIPLTILMPPGPIPIVASAVVLLVLMPRDPVEKIAYFIGVFPAVADFYAFNMPFPGMNYLIKLSYFKVAILVILLPIAISNVMSKRQPNPQINWNLVDSCVIFFAVYVALMTLREASFTATLRVVVDQFIVIVVPYLAISRTLTTKDAVDRALWGFLFMAVLTAWATAFSFLIQREFYTIHDTPGFTFRHGLLRVSTTMNTASVCSAAVCGFVIAQYFRKQSLMPRLQVWILYLVFFAALLGTANRGGQLQLGLALMAIFGLKTLGVGFRRLLLIGGALALLIIWPMIDWVAIDPTFAYRADLISASMLQFADHPFFGQVNFSANHYFDHLGQSFSRFGVREERFIDVVNWYLQVLLEYGLVGLLSFALPLLITVSWLYRQCSSSEVGSDEKLLFRYFVALFGAFVVVMATTSGISLMPLMLIILLAIARALTTMGSPKLVEQDNRKAKSVGV